MITGDFDKLGLLIANLNKLGEVPSRAATPAAKRITEFLKKEFTGGQDPYGKSWAPLRPSTLKRGRKPPPLTDTGKLKSGTVARAASGSGIVLEAGADYGFFHQVGTRKMKARPIFPRGTLPKEWSAVISDEIRKAFRKQLEL